LYVVGVGIGFAVQRWIGGPLFPSTAPPLVWRAPGVALIVAGVLLGASGVMAIHRAGSSIVPIKPVTALVVRGPYRWTRNPMYLGMALVSAGIAVGANALWPLLVLPVVVVVVRRMVIDREERYLERTFGREYRRYCDRVPRWI
jgi:protein-S-isoprenylcysteine O-methyltransferase Ste14